MRNICDRLAGAIVRRSAREDADLEVISYGLQGILGTALEFVFIIIAGVLLGILKEILVVSTVFVAIRLLAGGVHFSTYKRCLVSSVLMLVSGGFAARYMAYGSVFTGKAYIIAGSLFVIYSVYRYSPRDNPNRLITEEELPKFRRGSLAAAGIILAGLVLDLLLKGYVTWYHYSLVTGLLLESITLTDTGYRLAKFIEKKLSPRRC